MDGADDIRGYTKSHVLYVDIMKLVLYNKNTGEVLAKLP